MLWILEAIGRYELEGAIYLPSFRMLFLGSWSSLHPPLPEMASYEGKETGC